MARGSKRKSAAELDYERTPVCVNAKFFPGGQEPIPEGVSIRSAKGVQIRFQWQGQRCFETVPGTPTVGLVRRAIERREEVLDLIDRGRFKYEEEFPQSRRVREQARRQDLRKVPQVGAALDDWLALTSASVGPNTRDDYRRAVELSLKPMPVAHLGIVSPHPCAGLDLAALPVDELTAARLSTLRNHLFHEKGLSAKRVSNLLIPLRGLMPAMVADGHIRHDPFDLLKPLKDTRVEAASPVMSANSEGLTLTEVADFRTGKGKADPFTPSELNVLFERAYGPLLNTVVFWVDQGLRPGEVWGLQWHDFDLAAMTVTIRRSISKGKLKTIKRHLQRTVRLYPGALAAVEAQFPYSGAQRAWVFPNPATGRPWANESKFNKRWKRLVKAAGVRYRPPKQLRHTNGSTLLSANVSTIQAAYHLGHKDLTMLARHYGHFIAEVAGLPGSTFEEKFRPIWDRRIELLKTRQQPPGGDDWLSLFIADADEDIAGPESDEDDTDDED